MKYELIVHLQEKELLTPIINVVSAFLVFLGVMITQWMSNRRLSNQIEAQFEAINQQHKYDEGLQIRKEKLEKVESTFSISQTLREKHQKILKQFLLNNIDVDLSESEIKEICINLRKHSSETNENLSKLYLQMSIYIPEAASIINEVKKSYDNYCTEIRSHEGGFKKNKKAFASDVALRLSEFFSSINKLQNFLATYPSKVGITNGSSSFRGCAPPPDAPSARG